VVIDRHREIAAALACLFRGEVQSLLGALPARRANGAAIRAARGESVLKRTGVGREAIRPCFGRFRYGVLMLLKLRWGSFGRSRGAYGHHAASGWPLGSLYRTRSDPATAVRAPAAGRFPPGRRR
jgi:hypothetical protein